MARHDRRQPVPPVNIPEQIAAIDGKPCMCIELALDDPRYFSAVYCESWSPEMLFQNPIRIPTLARDQSPFSLVDTQKWPSTFDNPRSYLRLWISYFDSRLADLCAELLEEAQPFVAVIFDSEGGSFLKWDPGWLVVLEEFMIDFSHHVPKIAQGLEHLDAVRRAADLELELMNQIRCLPAFEPTRDTLAWAIRMALGLVHVPVLFPPGQGFLALPDVGLVSCFPRSDRLSDDFVCRPLNPALPAFSFIEHIAWELRYGFYREQYRDIEALIDPIRPDICLEFRAMRKDNLAEDMADNAAFDMATFDKPWRSEARFLSSLVSYPFKLEPLSPYSSIVPIDRRKLPPLPPASIAGAAVRKAEDAVR